MSCCNKKNSCKELEKIYYSCCCFPKPGSFNSYLNAHNSVGNAVIDNASFPFNTIDVNKTVTVTPAGVITIPKKGQYLITWNLNLLNDCDRSSVLTSILNQITPVAKNLGVASSVASINVDDNAVVNGTAIIDVLEDNSTFSIVNKSGVNLSLVVINGFASNLTVNRIN